MKKEVWQRLGKNKIEKERIVDLEANRKTLLFVRKRMLVKVKDVKKAFNCSEECARNRLNRLKDSGYLSLRKNNRLNIYFPTKKGFEKMPKKKIHEPLIVEKIKEVEKKVTKLDKTNYLGEI